MYPLIHLNLHFFEKDISTYGLVSLVGFLFFLIPGLIYSKKAKEDLYSRTIFLFFVLIFAGIGASVLYTITNIPYWIKVLPILFNNLSDWKNYMNFGLVYYGGFFGIFVGMMVYSKVFHEDVRVWHWQTIVSIPIFHALGRVGCVLAGCCYGKVVDHGGIYNAVIDKYCLPIQLYEAAGEVVIFLIILIRNIIKKDTHEYYKSLGIYCVLYGILRFIVEFWRGDKIRGIWGPFSTSQYISLVIIPIGIYCFFCPTEKNIFNKMYMGRRKNKK